MSNTESAEMLVQIYLDGYISGVASLALTLTEGNDPARAERTARYMGQQIWKDPAAMEQVCQQVKNRLTGNVNGDATTLEA